jgi:hypothetical protein
MLLDALAEKTPTTLEAMGKALSEKLAAIGRQMIKDGQPIKDSALVQAETRTYAKNFLENTLPAYQRLGAWTS